MASSLRSCSRARLLGAVAAVATLPFVASTAPAFAVDGVGGGQTSSARDQYDSGPDATPPGTPAQPAADVAPAASGGQQPAATSTTPATKTPAKKKKPAKRKADGKKGDGGGVKGDGDSGSGGNGGNGSAGDGDGNGVLGDGDDGRRDGDGNGVLGNGADGANDGSGAGSPTQAQAQLDAGSSLPFTGMSVIPVALMGLGLLAGGVLLRRRQQD